MPKSFYKRVLEIIKKIPKGRVATYGQIARYAGNPQASRQVAYILHSSTEKEKLPWHRVINSKGGISLRSKHGYELQKQMLEREGITFDEENRVDLDSFGWLP